MTQTSYALLASLVLLAVAPAEAKPARVSPVFVVSDQDTAPYLLGCARISGTKSQLLAGGACAGVLAGKPLSLDIVVGGSKTPYSMKRARFVRGSACPGPAKARFSKLRDDLTTMLEDLRPADDTVEVTPLLIAPETPMLEAGAASAERKASIDRALAHVVKRQKTRAMSLHGNSGPTVIGLVDLEGDGKHEIVVRDTSLYLLYSSDGKRLVGEVGCYFGG